MFVIVVVVVAVLLYFCEDNNSADTLHLTIMNDLFKVKQISFAVEHCFMGYCMWGSKPSGFLSDTADCAIVQVLYSADNILAKLVCISSTGCSFENNPNLSAFECVSSLRNHIVTPPSILGFSASFYDVKVILWLEFKVKSNNVPINSTWMSHIFIFFLFFCF